MDRVWYKTTFPISVAADVQNVLSYTRGRVGYMVTCLHLDAVPKQNQYGAVWNSMEQYGTARNSMEQYGAVSDSMEQ